MQNKWIAWILPLCALLNGNAQAASDEVVKDLFLDLKVYLFDLETDRREYESGLRAVPPPFWEESSESGAAVKKYGSIPKTVLLDNMGSEFNWNMLQDTDAVKNANLVDQHRLGFCTLEEKRAGLCDAGISVNEGGAADLLVNTLLSNPTLNAEGQTIALTFINNLTNPSPLAFPKSAFVSDEFTGSLNTIPGSPLSEKTKSTKIRILSNEGYRALAARYKQMAYLSVAQNALNQIAAERVEITGLGADLGIAGKENISLFEALKIETSRRYLDAEWHTQIYEKPQEALTREIANMMAVQLALDFKRYEQEQIITTLLATQVANAAQLMGQAEVAIQATTQQ